MKIDFLVKKHRMSLLTGNLDGREFEGVYVSDLMSYAIKNVQKDNIWVTVQDNMNIIAIASLKECAAIVIAESHFVSEAVIRKAKEENIVLIQTEKKIFEICRDLISESEKEPE